MKAWKIVSSIEALGYIILSLFIWYRKVDGSGAVNTSGNTLASLAVLSIFCAFLFLIQAIWLIIATKHSSSK
ncbi:DUF3923 family protein [Leuconostoc sp. UCMA20149]|uniref:DUF3923 family protein n=1 Tax=Leuconostoc sp. UCMA20149 TaxID=2583528 RepID=UPI0025B00AA8|nr:DUF3923 family protein [Leuconostoc sp. UCMA20149]MDN2451845.1 DUF3923 family protein [Leuconostoc sp. UCMA20149]